MADRSVAPLVLFHVQHTLKSQAWSGVQRVVRKLAETLPALAEVEFVKWDYTDGQLRYLDTRDLDLIFSGSHPPEALGSNAYAHRVNYRFGDTLPRQRAIWLLFPEIAYHSDDGTEVMTRIVAMCREYRIKTAAVFYDVIPVTNVHYRALKAQHSRYVMQLARCDRIYAISHYSQRQLEKLYASYVRDTPGFANLRERIVAAPLGSADDWASCSPPAAMNEPSRNKVILLGTIEPRKRQLSVLRAFRRLSPVHTAGVELHLAGSLHPDVALEFGSLLTATSQVHYHGYATQSEIDKLLGESLFTVFASDDEGFGLPIAESLAHGVPCMTANFGACAELAEGGGCLTVDVRDAELLTEAMRRLLSDPALLLRLRDETRSRKQRTWHDYTRQLLNDMQSVDEIEAGADSRLREQITHALAACSEADAPGTRSFPLTGCPNLAGATLVIDSGGSELPGTAAVAQSHGAQDLRVVVGEWNASRRDRLSHAVRALAWAFESPDTLEALMSDVSEAKLGGLLPPICIVGEEAAKVDCRVSEEIARHLSAYRRRQEIARRESLLQTLGERWPDAANGSALLTIVISTFNRAKFVQANVRWLLAQLERFRENIRVVVVDNASTDDTMERLAEFAQAPRLTIISNPVNVGMLGNLRVCSALMLTRHVWLTGDDDFIVPSGLAEIVDTLRRHPETPFLVTNFGVYHRAALGPQDTVQNLVAERRPLAAKPSPSGFYTVARIAEEHDNLFTAVYPIVFRSDLLAACFNYPFDRKPFIDLVEAVPTTKMLLESYASTQAYWCANIGIVGNLNNSWSVHRPRWHGVLMPQVLRLAREVGVDAIKLQEWSTLQLNLFREAERLARARNVSLDFSAQELEAGRLVFRQPISLS
jgi:glycosyltransferase involved in cell wall biosynthesis